MPRLLDRVLAHQNDAEMMASLARASRLSSGRTAAQCFAAAVPVIIERLDSTADRTDGATSLLRVARSLTWAERDNPGELIHNPNRRASEETVELLFGSSSLAVVDALAEGASAPAQSCETLLEITSSFVLATVAEDPSKDLTLERFVGLVKTGIGGTAGEIAPSARSATTSATPPVTAAAISRGLDDDAGKPKSKALLAALAATLLVVGVVGFFALSGGGETDDADDLAFATDSTLAPTTTEPNEEGAGEEAVDETRGDDQSLDTDTADGTAIESVDQELPEIVTLRVPMHDIEAVTPEASGVLSFDFNTVTGEVCYSVESINIEGPYRSHIHAGDFGVKGGIVVDLGPLESGATGCVDNLPVDTNAILANRAGHYAELHDLSEEWTIRGQLSETISGDVVSISVPMTDIKSIAPEASGLLNFDFNTVTGEVCYSVASDNIEGPYRSHIHVGEIGVQGGIVVDLGPLESGATGCVDNLPVDTNAILANRAGHYAELHDLSEEWTIRGQLSETIAGDVVAAQDAVVDTAGGGARTVLDGGTIFLEGEVPDQQTADELVASLDGVDSQTPIVNNLIVVEGAPLPSGRVVITDAIFFDVASDEINQVDDDTLAAIVALASSRDDWILTVVGHTDSGGSDVSNLELSLRRATAVRDVLAAEGIAEENLRVRGAGETAPIGDNSTNEGRAQNRRIEFELTPKG